MKNSNFEPEKTGEQLNSALEEKIALYSRVPHYVLILGERGTGKTTIAKMLHEKSARAKGQFINLNCASLSEGLLESELFGYEKGAFTGAAGAKAGLFEIASGGTLFLDEIGELPLALQAKLLKAVEEKRIRRVGSNVERPVDARIIAATSANLEQMVFDGYFRADLFDRLNILKLETIPLKFQKERVKKLLTESLDRENNLIGRATPLEFSPAALDLLENYDWHGNFRELHNFAARVAVECLDKKVVSEKMIRQILSLDSQPVAEKILPGNSPLDLDDEDFQFLGEKKVTITFDLSTDDLNRIYIKAALFAIKHALEQTDGSLRQAAQVLRTNHSTLSRILTKFDNGEIKKTPFHQPGKKLFAIAA